MTQYSHTQTGYVLLVGLGGACLVVAGLGVGFGWNGVLAGVFAVLMGAGVLFHSLTVQIRDGWLACWFGPGLIQKRFPLEDISEAEAVRNKWYYGWGVRYTPHGWLFNVSGLDAVQITLLSGKTYRIGTDEPEALLRAIRLNARLDD